MKIRKYTLLILNGSVGVLGFLFCGTAGAQAPPGPVPAGQPQPVAASEAKPLPPPPPPRQSILGAWQLNRDEGDRPRNSDSDGDSGGGSTRRSGGGWPGGGGYPGGGRGGYGQPRESEEERQKMRALLSPPRSMTFSMTGAEVDLLDDRDRKLALMTDGRKLKKSKDDNYQEIAAKWDGSRLVTDEKDPRGNKMSRTFELSEDGRQLYETLHLTSGRSNTSRTIRYVYDIPAPKPQ